MIKSNNRKAIVYGIVFLFLFTCLFPVSDSLAFVNNNTITTPILSSTDTKQKKVENEWRRSCPYGIAPSNIIYKDSVSTEKPYTLYNILEKDKNLLTRDHIAYAYNAYDPSGQHQMGWIIFNLDDPGSIDLIGPGFYSPSGADFLNEITMYFVTAQGGLYRWEVPNGQIIFIGPTIPLLGLTFDSFTGIWYASDSENLYSIDVNTGATTLIGSFNIVNTIIDIACDTIGNMYAYDVLWTGDSTLYSVNTSTGAATPIGLMGYGFVYAQGMAYDRDNAVLYIAGYFNDGMPSALLTCDVTTGMCTLVGYFECGMEICGFAIPWSNYQFDHDVEITGIVKPANGNAGLITPIVKVKNSGLNTETNVPVQLLIGKELITGTVEDFETNNGSYVHFAKLTDTWAWGVPTYGPEAAHSGSNLWATILTGNYPNNMWSGLMTQPFVVPSGANFKFWNWYQFESGWDGGNVKISTDGGTTYTIITPLGGYPGTLSSNPYMTGQPAYTGTSGTTWSEEEFDLSDYEGMEVIILWETASDSTVTYAGWYIDDVGFSSTTWTNEYTQTAYVSTIAPDEVFELSFPTWTPSDLGLIEDVNINYNAEATAMLPGDMNINNDYKEKPFFLHYGFFHDVAITQILSPVSGLAQTQTPKVAIENPGQTSENVTVSMIIGKALYTTLLEEDFNGGVPPVGWGTNYPSNWYSSSTNYAGGEAPEAQFSWTPSSVGEHLLYTANINTTGYTALLLQFKEYVNDYNGDYTLKIVTSIDGGVTWSDAYIRSGGPYGPTTTEVTLTTANGIGSATFMIAWDLSGDSFNINYWYIDDVWMGILTMVEEYNQTVPSAIDPGETSNVLLPDWTPADIPFATTIDYLVSASISLNTTDGNPTDNEIGKLITLSYEHDVGVIEITEPSGPSRNIIWDNYADDGTGTGLSSQLDIEYPFNSQCADDFQFTQAMDVNQVHWWGQFWNGGGYPNPCEFNIIFYADNGGVPTGAGMDDPTPTALAVYNFPAVIGVSYGADKYEYDVNLDPVFVADAGVKYWVAIQAVCTFSSSGQYGWSTNGANPDQLSSPVQGFPLLGTPYWTPTIYGDHAFQLSGWEHEWVEPWPPGTYPVEGLIENLGLTYTESNITVNTKITYLYYEEILIYNVTIVVPGPLTPGATTVAMFPNVTLSDDGDYVLEMQTMLPNDDHPSNNKKTWNFEIKTNPPPFTWAELTGLLGQNDWYISEVTVYLFAYDDKWPTGVNYTMIKIDEGEWFEYTGPVIVSSDDVHTVYFYSVDLQDNVEETRSVSFKIDQNAPTVGLSVEKNGLHQWRIITETSDQTSGIHLIQCYVDSSLYGEVFDEETYEWSWTGKGNHTVMVIAYDNAGNSASNTVTFSLSVTEFFQQHFQLFPFLSRILQIILSFFPKTIKIH